MLDGKEIIVTGAASGIGLETTRVIRANGGKVIAVDLNRPSVEVESYIQADLSDKRSIDNLIEQLPTGIDGLANIAGLPPTQPAEAVIAVNVVGLKYLTQQVVPKMAEGASIVNIASLAGIGWPESVASIKASEDIDFGDIAAFCKAHGIEGPRSYFFSKEAVIAWTHKNRWTWRDRGIRMNSVSPGPVETPILQNFIATLGERVEEDLRVMDRTGKATDIAPIVAFLLSEGSEWIRGANIPVDGGMNAYILAKTHQL